VIFYIHNFKDGVCLVQLPELAPPV